MDKEKIIDIYKDSENTPNKLLIESRDILFDEFEETKSIIIDLTRHLDSIETMYEKINNEIKKRGL